MYNRTHVFASACAGILLFGASIVSLGTVNAYLTTPQWVFLTGPVETIMAAQQAFEADRGSKFSHSPLTFLRAAGDDDEWVRLEGLVGAKVVLDEVASLRGEE